MEDCRHDVPAYICDFRSLFGTAAEYDQGAFIKEGLLVHIARRRMGMESQMYPRLYNSRGM